MVEPMILARMIQAVEVGAEDVVLDLACATGYSAAVLGRIARAVVASRAIEILLLLQVRELENLGWTTLS